MKWPELKAERRAAGVMNAVELGKEVGLSYYTIFEIENEQLGIDEEAQQAIRDGIARIAARRAEKAAEMATA